MTFDVVLVKKFCEMKNVKQCIGVRKEETNRNKLYLSNKVVAI